MDTRFKNQDLLIKALDRCIECRYHLSEIINIKYLIVNRNTMFEQALYVCETLSSKEIIYHTISKIYHHYITQYNQDICKSKQKGLNYVFYTT